MAFPAPEVPKLPEAPPTTAAELKKLREQINEESQKKKTGEVPILSLEQKDKLLADIVAFRDDPKNKDLLKLPENSDFLEKLKQFVNLCPTNAEAQKEGFMDKFNKAIEMLTAFGASTLKMFSEWFKSTNSWLSERLHEFSESAGAQIVELWKKFHSLKELKTDGQDKLEQLRKTLLENIEKLKKEMEKRKEDVSKLDFVEHVKSIAAKVGKNVGISGIIYASHKIVTDAESKPLPAAAPAAAPVAPAPGAPAAAPGK